MLYRESALDGEKLSILGYGCMRFTRKGGQIDLEKAYQEMKAALDGGVNYFDTAYIYPGSEACLGGFIEKYRCREKIHIATKLPHYFIKRREDLDKYFAEELSRLRTDYVDYYLLHMLNDPATFDRLRDMGILEGLEEEKRTGAIRHIGFSYHGGTEKFKALIDRYDWDFCQIQFNYLDEHMQAGVEGLTYAAKKGLPVIIMEPLRGGKLAGALPEAAKEIFRAADAGRSPAEWGLRWVWNHPEVTVVLSGMNDIAQVRENLRIASQAEAGSLGDEEMAVYGKVVAEFHRKVKVGCTGCGYCMPCPRGVDIPNCFAAYNQTYTESWYAGMKTYFMVNAMRSKSTGASECVGCGKCMRHCPQGIRIPEELKKVKKRMENPVFRIGRFFARRIQKY